MPQDIMPNRLFAGICLLLGLGASPAAAGCFGAGEPMFHCTFKSGKTAVNICLQDDVVTYAYGPRGGAPELLLARPADRVFMRPWPGIGRSIWEEFAIANGDYAYVVSYSHDKMAPDAPTEGYLSVLQGSRIIADLSCDMGSVRSSDFYGLFLAKEAAGQCWDQGADNWRDC